MKKTRHAPRAIAKNEKRGKESSASLLQKFNKRFPFPPCARSSRRVRRLPVPTLVSQTSHVASRPLRLCGASDFYPGGECTALSRPFCGRPSRVRTKSFSKGPKNMRGRKEATKRATFGCQMQQTRGEGARANDTYTCATRTDCPAACSRALDGCESCRAGKGDTFLSFSRESLYPRENFSNGPFPLPHPHSQHEQAAAQSNDAAAAVAAVSTATAAECPDAGAESHAGCEDPIKGGTPFDLWELARSWTPGFCASGGKRTCAKKECGASTMVPALTLHGMWPSFSTPVDPSGAAATTVEDTTVLAHHRRSLRDVSLVARPAAGAAVASGGACFWPQDCTQPGWWPEKAPWAYDPSLLPAGPEYEILAPAWYSDG